MGSPRRLAILACWLFCIALGARGQTRAAPQRADTLLVNGKIYTVNSRQPWAKALAMNNGKILAVGSRKEIDRYRGPATRIIDARGRLVLPGIIDCHIHFLDGSLSLSQVDLVGAGSVEEVQQRLLQYASAHPGKGWLRGRGWSYEIFGTATLPDKKMIDEVIADRPVFLEGFDGHTYWVNGKALALAGITRDTPDPRNGMIVRDPATGEPTGALKEDSAADLVRKVIPQPAREEKLAAVQRGLAEANRVGLVQVYSAGGDFDSLALFDELHREGKLTVRMYISDVVEPPELTAAEITKLEQARRRYQDDWLSAGVAKFFLDGVVETHTAAMLSPYADDPSQRGALFWDPTKYKQAVAELERRGFQIFTHAIGDAAVRLALDAYEQAEKTNGIRNARSRIEHIETISLEDISRFGQLGVIASFQPLHAYPDKEHEVWIRAAGSERATHGFAWRSVVSAGGRLAFGSDWPVVTLNPWPGVQTALTRQTADGQPPGGWVPEQTVTLTQALEAYTLGAAIAGRREKTAGSLEPGKVADLIVLSQNLFEIDPHRIGRTQVLLTIVGGRKVYQAPEWTAGREQREATSTPREPR